MNTTNKIEEIRNASNVLIEKADKAIGKTVRFLMGSAQESGQEINKYQNRITALDAQINTINKDYQEDLKKLNENREKGIKIIQKRKEKAAEAIKRETAELNECICELEQIADNHKIALDLVKEETE